MGRILVLTRNSDFHRLYSKGKATTHPILVTYVHQNREGYVRFGITTSGKIGNAVERNRCRRIIREAFSQLSSDIKEGIDLVFVARTKTKKVGTAEILYVMQTQLKAAGVMK